MLTFFVSSQGMPQLTDNKEFSVVNHLQADGMKVGEQSSISETHHLTKRESPASRVNNEVDNSIRNKRDVQNTVPNKNCCNTNNDGSGGGGASNCVCNMYSCNNMNNNNNNMGATVFNNIYYICNCGTNPNPNNIMSCCTPNNNKNCNCCFACQCGCNNGTNICMCSGGGGSTGNSCCSTSQSNSGGNVCYTFDKTCCNTQNTKRPSFNSAGFANHNGAVFVYNNYYYYCTCTPNNNIRHPSTCSTTCTCGCQPYIAQPFITPMTVTKPITDTHKERLDSIGKAQGKSEAESTILPQIFTNSYARTKPGVRFNPFDYINLGTNNAERSNPSVYTYTFARVHTSTPPRQSEPTHTPTTTPPRKNGYNRNNHHHARHHVRGFSGIDLSELFRRFKK